jgi:hypothetical protein
MKVVSYRFSVSSKKLQARFVRALLLFVSRFALRVVVEQGIRRHPFDVRFAQVCFHRTAEGRGELAPAVRTLAWPKLSAQLWLADAQSIKRPLAKTVPGLRPGIAQKLASMAVP